MMSDIKRKWGSFDKYIEDLFLNRFKQEGVFK
jgi:hypothetical protein